MRKSELRCNHACYVYVVFRQSGSPCYVGKGKGGRWQAHITKSHNRYLARLFAQADGNLPIVVVRDGLSDQQAFDVEKALIAALGRVRNGGLLVNLTDGGEGVSGHKQGPEQIRKLTETRIGRKHTDEAKEKVRAAFKGVPKSRSHCAAVSSAKKGKPGFIPSSETRQKMSMAQTGRQHTETSLAKMRGVQSGLSEEKKALKSQRITDALTGKRLSPEHRAKISAVQKGVPKPRKVAASASTCTTSAGCRTT